MVLTYMSGFLKNHFKKIFLFFIPTKSTKNHQNFSFHKLKNQKKTSKKNQKKKEKCRHVITHQVKVFLTKKIENKIK